MHDNIIDEGIRIFYVNFCSPVYSKIGYAGKDSSEILNILVSKAEQFISKQ